MMINLVNYCRKVKCADINSVIRIYTRNILDCDQPNYSLRIILFHVTAKLLSIS